MIRALPWYSIVGAVLVAAGAIYGFGWSKGRAFTERRYETRVAQLEADLSQQSAKAHRAAVAFLALEAASQARDKELEDEAREDPDADRPALSRTSVQRVFSR